MIHILPPHLSRERLSLRLFMEEFLSDFRWRISLPDKASLSDGFQQVEVWQSPLVVKLDDQGQRDLGKTRFFSLSHERRVNKPIGKIVLETTYLRPRFRNSVGNVVSHFGGYRRCGILGFGIDFGGFYFPFFYGHCRIRMENLAN